MQSTTLTINGTAHHLAQGQDLMALKKEIEDAVHAGGRMVDFLGVGDTVMSVLVTPYLPLLLEQREIVAEPRDADQLVPSFDPDDFDF